MFLVSYLSFICPSLRGRKFNGVRVRKCVSLTVGTSPPRSTLAFHWSRGRSSVISLVSSPPFCYTMANGAQRCSSTIQLHSFQCTFERWKRILGNTTDIGKEQDLGLVSHWVLARTFFEIGGETCFLKFANADRRCELRANEFSVIACVDVRIWDWLPRDRMGDCCA